MVAAVTVDGAQTSTVATAYFTRDDDEFLFHEAHASELKATCDEVVCSVCAAPCTVATGAPGAQGPRGGRRIEEKGIAPARKAGSRFPQKVLRERLTGRQDVPKPLFRCTHESPRVSAVHMNPSHE